MVAHKNWKAKFFLYLLPSVIFLFGCSIHFQRGYYYIDLTSTHAQGADDAYISYRYGWNLAHDGELSWNESGYRRTEGFTNPLWVYLSAAWALLGMKEWVYPLMVGISVLAASVLLILLIHTVYSTHQRSGAAVIGLILVAAAPAVWLHTTSGLESGVFGLGLALLAYLVLFGEERRSHSLTILCLAIFLGLLRSDGFIYLGIILIAALIAGSKSWKALAFGLLFSGLGLIVWRQVMFGAWLPNTAVAKVNFSLLERLQVGSVLLLFTFINSGLFVILILGLAGIVVMPRRKQLASFWILLVWLAYYLYIGGDIYFERHLVGLFFLAAAFSAPLWFRTNRILSGVLVLLVLAGIALSIRRDMGRFDYRSPKSNDPLVMLGQALEVERSRYGVLISAAAGKIPYYAGGDCIDPFGLNDPYLATKQRPKFMPGHSAGSDLAAIEMARSHPSGVYATFSFLDKNIVPSPESISMWIDNRHPQDTVQRKVTQQQWDAALETGDLFIWSIISQPVQVSSQNP